MNPDLILCTAVETSAVNDNMAHHHGTYDNHGIW